ncbi:hypothetical protein C5955_04820 [Cronobacter sakazakii]|nr:hypothetical protein C5955_04820 [Cronobacter sakazakii]
MLFAIFAPGCARNAHVLRVRSGGCAHAGTELTAPPTAFYSVCINCRLLFPQKSVKFSGF